VIEVGAPLPLFGSRSLRRYAPATEGALNDGDAVVGFRSRSAHGSGSEAGV